MNRYAQLLLACCYLSWSLNVSHAATTNDVCNLEETSVPAQCLRFKRSCPVLQSCVMDWVLRNEDIKNFDVGTLALKPLDTSAGSADENTLFAEPTSPVVVQRSPVIPQGCKADMMQAVTEDLAAKKGLPFQGAEQRLHSHMQDMFDNWSAQGWQLQPSKVFAHLHECRDVCGAMIARLAQCHIWAVSNAKLKSLVTFEVNQHKRTAIRETYPMSVAKFVQDLPVTGRNTQRQYHVAVIGRASRDGDAEYNYDLSYKRAHTVRAYLLDQGVPRDNIKLLWLGEQSPQIHPAMIEGYELQALYKTLGDDQLLKINRSVLMVAYPVDTPVEIAQTSTLLE